TPRVHAIVGAKIVVAPGKTIDHGTIVIRDGVIAAVGTNVPIPADARIWEGDSLTIYPGLIDAFVLPSDAAAAGGQGGRPAGRQQGGRPAQTQESQPPRGPAHEVPGVHPEKRVVESLPLSNDQIESLRAAGFAAIQLAPRNGILRGTSTVIGLGQGAPNRNVVTEDAAHVIALDPDREN